MKYLFILLLFFSCAQVELKKLNPEIFQKTVKGVCLNGEGKGRIEIEADKYLFSFDSIFRNRDHWLMGVEIPFRGEEDFQILKMKKGFGFRGSFYRKIREGYKGKHLSRFLKFLAQNIFEFKNIQEMSDEKLNSYFYRWCGSTPVKKCTFLHNDFKYEVSSRDFKVSKKLEEYTLVWSNRDLSGDERPSFERSLLSLSHKDETLLSTHFFYHSCQNETSRL